VERQQINGAKAAEKGGVESKEIRVGRQRKGGGNVDGLLRESNGENVGTQVLTMCGSGKFPPPDLQGKMRFRWKVLDRLNRLNFLYLCS
jgi:hypothetical protein